MNPLISVIIDTYNYGEFVADAIQSALNQTLPRDRYEIIVIDDGSQDDTRERIARFLPEISYLYKQNGGQASAFNAGLALAKGEFVAFLDADDYWYPDKLATVLQEFAQSESVDVVYHTLRMVDTEGRELGDYPKSFAHTITGNPLESFLAGKSPFISATSGISCRLATLRKLLPIPEDFRICADGYLMMGMPFVARTFSTVEQPLGYYRMHGRNAWATSFLREEHTAESKQLHLDITNLQLLHVERLAERFGHRSLKIFADLKLQNVSDEVLIEKMSGTRLNAFRLLLRKQKFLANVRAPHRLFKFCSVSLQLLLPRQFFEKIRLAYTQTFFWTLVQRYVK
jgi:glycosyltransferase involved in cell wall biosynthesis